MVTYEIEAEIAPAHSVIFHYDNLPEAFRDWREMRFTRSIPNEQRTFLSAALLKHGRNHTFLMDTL